MVTIPQEFDWVKAKGNCSTLSVFNELRLGVEGDVNAALRPDEFSSSPFAFRANTLGDYFIVFRQENAGARVEFNCETNRITIRAQDKELVVMLTLNNEGRCKLRIGDGDELEQWQVRRIALERLFFGPSVQ
jgi:hypothetical protein